MQKRDILPTPKGRLQGGRVPQFPGRAGEIVAPSTEMGSREQRGGGGGYLGHNWWDRSQGEKPRRSSVKILIARSL